MKTLATNLTALLCCLPLMISDTMARGGGGRDGGASRDGGGYSGGGYSGGGYSGGGYSGGGYSGGGYSGGGYSGGGYSGGGANRSSFGSSSGPMSGASRNPITQSWPTSRPSTQPTFRPSTQPLQPGTMPAARPATRPMQPGALPPARPTQPMVRPGTLPGNVIYPQPAKPVTLPVGVSRPSNTLPGTSATLPAGVTRQSNNIAGVGSQPPATRPIHRPDFSRPSTLPADRTGGNSAWWNSGTAGNRSEVGTGNPSVNPINNNFRNNLNWSTNRSHWGYNPWWNHAATRPWYGGSWNCGWNHHYYHHSYWGGYRPWPGYIYDDYYYAAAIGWGLLGWNLGNLIYYSGYQNYYNPYPAPAVIVDGGNPVTYAEPITTVAARTAPADGDASKMTAKSESFVAESQAAFKLGDYLLALESADKAVSAAPGDGALHEYRALVLFALGKYSEAAGVLNPVLAGSPGWNWTTMISLYDAQPSYTSQLQALEQYAKANPQAADVHFLLGYHYMVCGQLGNASGEFAVAAKLQPADKVSAQLRDLTRASSNNGDADTSDAVDTPVVNPPPPRVPVPLAQLAGNWVADKGAQGTVTLVFKDDGEFIWTYKNGEKTHEFAGDFRMNDNGMLVLDAKQSQMVAAVELPQEGQLKFVLAGGPPGDPGLLFVRK